MNQGPNRLLDEFAKLMTDAAGAAQGVKREIDQAMRSQAERFLASMDLVKRDDFEAVKEMAANARAQNEALAERIAALEARIAALAPAEGGEAAKTRKK
jgi:BMFP domain-containing protein YqiC